MTPRWHIHHLFSRPNQLLSQQIPVTIGGLDRPPPGGEPLSPPQQLLRLAPVGSHYELSEDLLTGIHCGGRMGTLMGMKGGRHSWSPGMPSSSTLRFLVQVGLEGSKLCSESVSDE